MRFMAFSGGLLAALTPLQCAFAQNMLMVPYGGTAEAPVPMHPASPPDDTPEEIAEDAARDLKDTRFYNKPGATRAAYDAAWQECRLIARGSRTPSGTVPYYYNPAVISPMAAATGGAIGGLIGGLIVQGEQRRANRRNCLLIRGWRLVEVPAAEATRIAAMTAVERDAHFNSLVGAAHVDGKVTERSSFSLQPDSALDLDAPIAGPGQVFAGKKIDPARPIRPGAGEAVVILTYRRPDIGSAGRSGRIALARYDVAGRDLIYRPKDWKKAGDKTTYQIDANSRDRQATLEVQVLRVTPGDYVIHGTEVGNIPITKSYCFGAPTFHVGEGEVAYIGDFIPYMNVRLSGGAKLIALAHTSHIEDARRTLADKQPELAAAMQPATLRNGATYACSAITMDRWDLNGVATLPDPAPTEPAAADAVQPMAEAETTI